MSACLKSPVAVQLCRASTVDFGRTTRFSAVSSLPFYRRPISGKAVGKYVLKSLTTFAVLTLLTFAWHARPLRPAAEYGIAPRALPSPNAHDLYLQTYEVFERSRGSGKAVALILDASATVNTVDDDKTYPLARKVRWLQQNKRGFELFDQALRAEYGFPVEADTPSDGKVSSEFALRWLARYVSVECQVLSAQGHHDKALQRALDVWQMGLSVAHGAPLTAALNGMAIEAIARRALDGEIAHLNATQARAAARRLKKQLETRVPWSQVLQQEHDTMLLNMKRQMEVVVWEQKRNAQIEEAFARGETSFSSTGDPAPELHGPIVNWQVRRMSNEFVRGMEPVIASANAPWSKRETTLPNDLSPQMSNLISVLDKGRFNFARAETFGQLMLARLALHAFRKERGVYPPTLDALVPTYLLQTPRDAFADNHPLRYRREGSRYKLWSVGPDGRDDSARPAVNSNARTPQGRFLVFVDAAGDIVANISR
jgi:hypothetical protein